MILNKLNYSQNILLALIQKGVSRQKAYKMIQTAAFKVWNSNKNFEEFLNNDNDFKKYFNTKELKKLFKDNTISNVNRIFKATFK